MGEHQKLKTFTRKHNNKFRTVLDLSAHQLFTTAQLHLLGFKNNIVCNASGRKIPTAEKYFTNLGQ